MARALIIALLLPAAAFASPVAARLPLVTPGCQGEGCSTTGTWVVTRPLALYARPFAKRPLATLRTGERIEALGGEIWTTRLGSAVLVRPVVNYDVNGRKLSELPAGTRVSILFYEGEGIVMARTADGRRLSIEADDYRELRRFRASDWVRVRRADGRTGWISHDYDRLACSSHIDSGDSLCRAR